MLGPIVFVGQLLWALGQAPSGWEVVTVGAVGTLRGVGTLTFGLYAGALADRFDRRRLLLVLQITAVVLALLSAAVAHWGGGEVWGLVGLYALTLGLAAVQPADTATRNAVVAELLGPATQTGLGALPVVMQGPALLTLLFSGDILSALDFSGTFVVVAAAFGLNALVLLPLHYRPRSSQWSGRQPWG